jgi:fatty acid desaturase
VSGVRQTDPARAHALVVELAHRLRRAGCFERADGRYARRLAILVPAFAAAFVALHALRPGALWAALSVATAFASVQLGIVSHDAGHRMVHRRRGWNTFWGHAGMTFACGLSFTHWCLIHDAHHRHAQDESRDPDMQYARLFSVAPRAAAARRGLARRHMRVQHLTFWPLAALYAWSLRGDSIARVVREPARTRIDRWVLPAHYALWLIAPALVVGPLAAAFAYLAVSTLIGLYLVAIFAPNHIGMPSLTPDAPVTHLDQQTGTTRDVTGGRTLAIVMGGLEHQIEHHLFPRIVQPRLAAARAVVTAFCAEHGLPHHACSFRSAHREVLRHLSAMARVRGET